MSLVEFHVLAFVYSKYGHRQRPLDKTKEHARRARCFTQTCTPLCITKSSSKTYLHLQPPFRVRILNKLPHRCGLRIWMLPQLARRRHCRHHHDRCLVLDLSLHEHSCHLLLVERSGILIANEYKEKGELETNWKRREKSECMLERVPHLSIQRHNHCNMNISSQRCEVTCRALVVAYFLLLPQQSASTTRGCERFE